MRNGMPDYVPRLTKVTGARGPKTSPAMFDLRVEDAATGDGDICRAAFDAPDSDDMHSYDGRVFITVTVIAQPTCSSSSFRPRRSPFTYSLCFAAFFLRACEGAVESSSPAPTETGAVAKGRAPSGRTITE
ncbi:hypothetical protein DL770_005982 [Monosporascus sp. CRB-9-2]|nr:hypothetical protein DL770_005982 [Monosporascus sp. CRB-9-2]